MPPLLLMVLLLSPAAPLNPLERQHLERILHEQRKKHEVPALGAAIVTSKGITEAVVGVRKEGTTVKATLADQWHLGSDSKAMTAMLLAILIERKLLRYDSTMERIFPELRNDMHPDYRKVTVEQLLRHQAGLPTNLPGSWWKISTKLAVRKQRELAARELLSSKPEHPPGTKFHYSNSGYVLAGHIAERVGKESWEAMMKRYIFDPLKMKSAGFGPPGSSNGIDQPWPHNAEGKPIPPGAPAADNPPVMGPAGRVHCSLSDWGAFVRDVMEGAEGKAGLLSAQGYKKLIETAEGESYTAGGWGRGHCPLGFTLSHDGSNTLNYCSAAVIPQAGVAILVVCNQGGKKKGEAAAREARDAIWEELIKKR